MLKKFLYCSLFLFVVFTFLNFSIIQNLYAQEKQEKQERIEKETVRGTVQEIAKDGSYIIVNDKKILTTDEFLEDSYLELGDEVEIIAEKTANGLKVIDYKYIFDENEELQSYEYERDDE